MKHRKAMTVVQILLLLVTLMVLLGISATVNASVRTAFSDFVGLNKPSASDIEVREGVVLSRAQDEYYFSLVEILEGVGDEKVTETCYIEFDDQPDLTDLRFRVEQTGATVDRIEEGQFRPSLLDQSYDRIDLCEIAPHENGIHFITTCLRDERGDNCHVSHDRKSFYQSRSEITIDDDNQYAQFVLRFRDGATCLIPIERDLLDSCESAGDKVDTDCIDNMEQTFQPCSEVIEVET